MSDEQHARPSFDQEIEHGSDDYSTEELLDHAQANAQALLLGTVQHLGKDEPALRAWQQDLASLFARGWDTERAWSNGELLDAILTNLRAFGATVDERDLTGHQPTAIVSGFPDPALVEVLGLDPSAADRLLEITSMLARSMDAEMSWRRDAAGRYQLTVGSSQA